ncbi:MAG: hypothetical protein KAI24_07745, partial [Planctomycetes bacterium]|nr:hypothetical protein [Planctomycetota bacterium]
SFSATLRGGDVQLERRVVRSSLLTGLLSSGADALLGGSDEHDYEQRAMLGQMTVDAQLTLFPRAKGRVLVNVDRLELAAFRGLAKQAGVDIADGVFDTNAAIDLRGHDGMRIDSESVFTWLALDEPPDGPITTYLRLPAPLQTVLFLLRNNQDEQRIPLNVTVPPGEAGEGKVVEAVVESLAKLIGEAFSSAGARAATTITGAFFGGDTEVPDVKVALPFEPGAPLPGEADLAPLLEALQDDDTLVAVLSHQLGQADLAHAAELANPPADVVAATAQRLQQVRRDLEARRDPIARDVVALYAAGKVQEAIRRQEELLAIDTHLGELLVALDGAVEQLGRPDERAAARRTRTAAIALAEARLDATIRHILLERKDLGANRFDRRAGRGVPTAGVDEGGFVVVTLRRRSAQVAASK